jgi:hypothetical protein
LFGPRAGARTQFSDEFAQRFRASGVGCDYGMTCIYQMAADVRVTLPAPINPTSITDLLSFYYQYGQRTPSRALRKMLVRDCRDADLASLF